MPHLHGGRESPETALFGDAEKQIAEMVDRALARSAQSGTRGKSGLIGRSAAGFSQRLTQAGERLFAQLVSPSALDFPFGVTAGFECKQARFGEDGILSALVDRVRVAANEAQPLELVERLLHGLLGHAKALGKQRLGDPRKAEMGKKLRSCAEGRSLAAVQLFPDGPFPGGPGKLQQRSEAGFVWAVKHLDQALRVCAAMVKERPASPGILEARRWP